MTYIQIINDVHLSDHCPVNCVESYTDDLFDLLNETVEVAKEYKSITVFAGDLYHIKMPSRNSHQLVQRTIDLIKRYPNQVYIVPGNHDLLNSRMDSIPSQPIGVLLKAGAELLNGWTLNTAQSFKLYGVPWLQRFTNSNVNSAFQSYREHLHDVSGRSLVVTHAPLYPPGKELPYEFYPASEWAKSMANRGSVAYGHVHDYHGVWEVEGVQFCNNGALSRGSLTESNKTRDVYTTLWSSINGEFKSIKLNAKPASEVFKLEKVDKIKKVQLKLDDFLSAVGQITIEVTSVDSVLSHVRSLGLSDRLVNTVKELLDEVTEK